MCINFFLFALPRALRPTLLFLFSKVGARVLQGESWRLVSAAFLHVHVIHLLVNSVFLFAVGSACEILFGRDAFVSVYLSGAMFGNVASCIADPFSTRASVGSSGAVFALVGGMVVHLMKNGRALGPRARDTTLSVALASTLAIVLGFFSTAIDAWAHLGGFVAGAIAATSLVPTVSRSGRAGMVQRKGRKESLAVVAVAAMLALISVRLVGILWTK